MLLNGRVGTRGEALPVLRVVGECSHSGEDFTGILDDENPIASGRDQFHIAPW